MVPAHARRKRLEEKSEKRTLETLGRDYHRLHRYRCIELRDGDTPTVYGLRRWDREGEEREGSWGYGREEKSLEGKREKSEIVRVNQLRSEREKRRL